MAMCIRRAVDQLDAFGEWLKEQVAARISR